MNKKLLFIFILAFFVRIIALNQSLWLDEATTAKVVQIYSFTDIITKFSPFDFHPPLYYLLMKLWTNVFGYSEIVLRLPSVIFSLMAGYMVYRIAIWLYGYMAGIWAVLFFLFNPLIIYYSQEARMYMMATFLLTASLYYFIHLCHPEFISGSGSRNTYSVNKFGMTKLSDLLLFNLFIVLGFVTFYGSVFLVAAFLLYFLYKKKYTYLFICLFVVFVYFLTISPLLLQQFIHARESLQIVLHWKQVLGAVTIKNLLLIPLKFSSGRISFQPKIFSYLLTGTWTAFMWFFVVKGGFRNKLLFFLMVAPLMIGLAFSFFSPLLQYFRFLYLVPIMSILLARNTTVYRYAVVIGFLFFSLLYLSFPQFHREDWKSLTLSLRNTRAIYMITPSSDALKYYNPQLAIKELRTLEAIELEKKVTIIPYTADIYGFDYKKELMRRGFTYKEAKTFRGLWYEVWVKNKDYAHTGSFRYSFITAKT